MTTDFLTYGNTADAPRLPTCYVAAATGRTALARQPVPAWTFAPGREPNWRNLMVQCAVSGMFRSAACSRTPPGSWPSERCVDPVLNRPYVDLDEKRKVTDTAADVTVDVRYIHGGFTGTKAKSALYFPLRYQGRFFESTYPTLATEEAAANAVAFAITNGAYAVSTNNAGGLPGAGDIAGYRVNAAAAKFSRTVARQVYGDNARPRGYIYGASGGAYQTIGALENTEGVWDGGVPMVPGSPNAIPSSMTVELLALRVLRDVFPRIVDALEPGGSGDPYAGLTDEQQSVLREATRLGLPPGGWWDYRNMSGGAFFAVAGGVRILDPTYVEDFWTKPTGTSTARAATRSGPRSTNPPRRRG
ncbi:hypothetical protein [Pseudofrankia saprophytica]